MAPVLSAASIRVPCSTSNLGAGFDCIGLALNRFLHAEYFPTDQPLTVTRRGTLASIPGAAADDLFVRVFAGELARHGATELRGQLLLESGIPIARGLGSSAASTVGALMLAAAVRDGTTDRAAVLREAERLEGHPDNAAPALYGGLVAVAHGTTGDSRVMRLPLSPDLGFAWAAPHVEVPTPLARKALPAEVPHRTAVRALGRVSALLQGLATGDAELLRIGFDDELHVPYRLPLIPHAEAAFAAARDAGAYAVTISGSGSGLIAVSAKGHEQAVADAMANVLGTADDPPRIAFAAEPVDGAMVTHTTLPTPQQ